MARKHFNLTREDEQHVHGLLGRLNELGVDPVNFLSDAVHAEEELPDDRRAYSGRDLVAVVAGMIPRRARGILDEDGYHGPSDPSPWHSPTIQGSLYALRFNLPLLAEILREIANEVDPPETEKRPGRPRSAIRDHERRRATLRLFIERLRLTSARRSLGHEEDPRIREALALRLDANETAAVLAFARLTGFSAPLADVDVDEAVRYFNTARKGKKPLGFVPRKPNPKGGPCGPKEGPICPDRARPTAPAEPDSPSTFSPSSSARTTSRASSASPKATPVRSKRATPPRPGPSRSAAPSSATSPRGSRTSATSRPRPKRRRKEPDGS